MVRLEKLRDGEWRTTLHSAPDALLSACAVARVRLQRPWWLRAAWWTRRAWVTIGTTIYPAERVAYPEGHPSALEHELVHVRQWLDLGPVMWLMYVGLPLPVGLAWTRYYLEREAYGWQIRHHGADPEACATAVASWLYVRTWPRAWALAYFRRIKDR